MIAAKCTLTVIGVLISIFSTGQSIKCFQCDSSHEGCSALTEADVNSKYFQECGNKHSAPFCRKTIQTILDTHNIVRITRSCGWKTTTANSTRCFNNDTQFKLDVTCQCYTDGCNSAPSLTGKSTFFHSLIPALSLFTLKIL